MQISATSVCTVNPPTCSHQFLLLLFLTLLTPHYIFIPVVLYVFLKSNKTPDWVLRKPSPWSVLCQRVFTGLTLQLPSVVAMHPVSISLFLCSSVCTRICFKKALNDVKTTRQWTICRLQYVCWHCAGDCRIHNQQLQKHFPFLFKLRENAIRDSIRIVFCLEIWSWTKVIDGVWIQTGFSLLYSDSGQRHE